MFYCDKRGHIARSCKLEENKQNKNDSSYYLVKEKSPKRCKIDKYYYDNCTLKDIKVEYKQLLHPVERFIFIFIE